MSDRQVVRRTLTELLQANLACALARREHSADSRPETAQRYELARAAAARLQADARHLVAALGTRKERARLTALLNVRWAWLASLAFPI